MDNPETTSVDALVSVEWLRLHIDDPDLRVVDIRGYVDARDHGGGRQTAEYRGAGDEYRHGRIPGAVFVDWTSDIVDHDSDVKAQVAPPAVFADAMERVGIGDTTHVVVADHSGGHFATRLWWALHYYGHDQVSILDGGYASWSERNMPLGVGKPKSRRVTFTPRVRASQRSEPSDILTSIRTGDRQIVDARDAEQFTGAIQRGSRGGHIPTARNISAKAMFNADGTWKQPDAIRVLLEDAGVDIEAPVTAYCNGGVTATAVLFGLHRAGYRDLSNYDGSWNEWGERCDLPVEGDRDLWNDPG